MSRRSAARMVSARSGRAAVCFVNEHGETADVVFYMTPEDRSRSRPLPPDRPRQDQAEPAQVHLAGRDDRPEGQGHRLDPAAADRHPALPLRRQAAGRRRPGRRRGRRPARPGRRSSRAQGSRPASDPGEHLLEVDVTLDELAEILGEELELPRHRAQGQEQDRRAEGSVHRHPHASAPSRCATSSARTAGAEAPDRDGHLRPEEPDHRPDPRRQALPLVEDRDRAAVATPSSST